MLGLVGGLSALTSPVLAPVWTALTVTLASYAKGARPLAISVIVATAIVALWVGRNAVVFGRFLPVRSNLAFELYQSQCLEEDGVLRQETAFAHPYASDGADPNRYEQKGEMGYLDEKRRIFLASVSEDPLAYLERVGKHYRSNCSLCTLQRERSGQARVRELSPPPSAVPRLGLDANSHRLAK